jgi:hypothetical protein
MASQSKFEERDFLSAEIEGSVANFRAENADWFKLSEDMNAALMRAALNATEAVKTNLMDPRAVAVRALLRSCGMLQGVVLLTERGMVAEARTLVRCMIENAFCIAALLENPEVFMAMLKADSEASRQLQRKFINENDLVTEDAQRERLEAAIAEFDKAQQIMSPKKVARLGPILKLYISYQRLSDDSAHLSARSLDRHVMPNEDRTGWAYRRDAGNKGDNAATFHHAMHAALSIGVGITQMLGDKKGNAEFGELAERFYARPPVPVV